MSTPTTNDSRGAVPPGKGNLNIHQSAIDPQQQSQFMQLPGELRNQIYRYAITGSRSIRVYNIGFERPGLLNCCKKTRHETKEIFYYENEFHLYVIDYDSTPVYKLKLLWTSLHLAEGKQKLFGHPEISKPHWINILRWLARCYRQEVNMPPAKAAQIAHDRRSELELHTLDAIFATARLLRSRVPWPGVLRMAYEHRAMLIRRDERWASDSWE